MHFFKKHSSKLVVLLIIAALVVLANTFIHSNFLATIQESANQGENKEHTANSDSTEKSEVQPIIYEVTQEDQNAFEILKATTEATYKEYDFGVFVESINGVAGDDKHFWALYVNNEQSKTGADQTIVTTGDTVEWRYEEIK